MDLSGLFTTAGESASSRVAMALAPKTSNATATAKVTAKDTTTGTDSSGATDGSTSSTTDADNSMITSNDFLTLLVSELKNQDPTQPTDPTTYINQLVGVNSLQQLISINQGLSTFEDSILG
ncbi:MAG: flagellar hook capping FlgD N-terminal domain-containing protein [Edaphobacter sp.]|uniref:flagellar hook assembly protein FlgD n=1 Tax=Edaphobacter sp. TaxID=1934404 RepID=UPI0023A3410A|nr:flagellar hook capping FlgD N-terminal domain-containing protein [Edaphobacter sp.]MDE1178376.1 flagellar hook capping FlgD N-terminal domain-containing protein [Edaphobacter sp.]